MTLKEKLSLLEEIMELEEGILSEDIKLGDLEEWDSLSQLSLIASAKKVFNKKLTMAVLKDFQSIGDICAWLG